MSEQRKPPVPAPLQVGMSSFRRFFRTRRSWLDNISARSYGMKMGEVRHPNVTVYDNVDIGRGTIIHSGAVIGADGFGYVMEHERWHKFPQVGRVEIAYSPSSPRP